MKLMVGGKRGFVCVCEVMKLMVGGKRGFVCVCARS